MSVWTPFAEARAALGLAPDEHDAAAVKRAYRLQIAAHPPDRDPDGFRRARDAYELLSHPLRRAQALLLAPVPAVPPPSLPEPPPPPPRGATAIEVLRAIAARLDPAAWTPSRGAS